MSASAADELAARPLARLTPVLGGALSGRRVAIDPAGGGKDAFGRGPDMLRGATINLELARRLRGALEAAGASAILTRSGEETLSIHERIHAVNASRADLALGLRYGSGLPEGGGRFVFTHYPSSAAGKAAAESMMETVSRVPPCGRRVDRGIGRTVSPADRLPGLRDSRRDLRFHRKAVPQSAMARAGSVVDRFGACRLFRRRKEPVPAPFHRDKDRRQARGRGRGQPGRGLHGRDRRVGEGLLSMRGIRAPLPPARHPRLGARRIPALRDSPGRQRPDDSGSALNRVIRRQGTFEIPPGPCRARTCARRGGRFPPFPCLLDSCRTAGHINDRGVSRRNGKDKRPRKKIEQKAPPAGAGGGRHPAPAFLHRG